jgi:uncharacterized membrane protein
MFLASLVLLVLVLLAYAVCGQWFIGGLIALASLVCAADAFMNRKGA